MFVARAVEVGTKNLPKISMEASAHNEIKLSDHATKPASRSNEWPKVPIVEGIPVKHLESDIVALVVALSKPVQKTSKLTIDISADIPPFRRRGILELRSVPFWIINIFQVSR